MGNSNDTEKGGARSPSAPFPRRRKLPHDIPDWVENGAIHFITIDCAQRGINQLAIPDVAVAVGESLLHRQQMGQWWMRLFLLMPDHAHGLIAFNREISMRQTMEDWKRYIARKTDVKWQGDFFDHRIRDQNSLSEKWHYIRNNPVRQKLANTPDEWPYQ